MDNIMTQLEFYASQYGLNLIFAILILVVGLWLAKVLTKSLMKTLNKKNVDPTLSKFIIALTRIALILFVILAAINRVGIQTTSFVAVLGAAAFAVGFALQGSLSNFASGVMLIIFRPLKVGDYIEGAGQSGTVEEVGIFVTILKTPDNKVIFIPNSKLMGDSIINYSVKDKRRVDMVFGISYSDDIDKAKKVINQIISNDPRILKDPAPQIVVSALADSSVNFYVRPWVNSADYWGVYFDITEAIKKSFDDHELSIPFPQRDVYIHQS